MRINRRIIATVRAKLHRVLWLTVRAVWVLLLWPIITRVSDRAATAAEVVLTAWLIGVFGLASVGAAVALTDSELGIGEALNPMAWTDASAEIFTDIRDRVDRIGEDVQAIREDVGEATTDAP